jgi:hypothetical protein
MTDLQVQTRAIEDLIPYAKNSRTHSEGQVNQIAASIKEFGWTNPILIDGSDNVIAGHGRLQAAMKLGMVEVPVITLSHLSEAQRKALVIADNKLALNASWDETLLKAELESLFDDGFDCTVMGYTNDELNELLDIDGDALENLKEESEETNYVIQYNIVFDNEQQQTAWFAFIKMLKAKYEDYDTLAERLTAFLQENSLGEG